MKYNSSASLVICASRLCLNHDVIEKCFVSNPLALWKERSLHHTDCLRSVNNMGCAKVFLFFFNAIYLGISAAVIYLAVWLIKKFGDISKITTNPHTFVPCGILVGIGVVIFVTALFGCCGAGSDSKCCLSVFVFLLFIVFALEVAAGVMGCIYQNKAEGYLSEGFIDAIKSYDPNHKDSLEKAVDALQKSVSSYCNFNELFFKWNSSVVEANIQMTGVIPNIIHYVRILGHAVVIPFMTIGCLNKLTDEVKQNLDYVLGIAIGVAVFQLLGIVGAFYLMCCSREQGYLKIRGGTHV
ncbi:Tetraspanin-36 [Acropora cervicornis]|uniref:Tetraspanin-36 n=1 Tax=Acropora cervicornis TaxID=6130 RepID=A0AAD9V2W5_ACRCE|nr:Tetraspanin-36 [Acropora cervicornis]